MKISKITKSLVAVATIFGLAAAPTMAAMAFSVNDCPGYSTATAKEKESYNIKATSIAECYTSSKDSDNNLMGTLNTILNVVFGVIGFVAVVMLVYGGIQYTISSGDAGKVKKAKDTILYGIVGLIIALLAAAIVNFVLAGVFKG